MCTPSSIAALLQQLFVPVELDRFTLALPDGPTLLAGLPGESWPHADRCLALARLLSRRGELGADLCEHLALARPARRSEIVALFGGHVPTGPATVYVTSALAGRTVALSADLRAPAGLLLAAARQAFDLPEGISWGGLHIRLHARLARAETPLVEGESLESQGVAVGELLTLLVERRERAEVPPVQNGRRTVWRGQDEG